MIEKDEFKRAWTHIVERFGKDFNPKIAAAYYDFLSPQMETAEFLAAARVVWANAKWFPRPADFLLAGCGDEWRTLTKCLDAYHAPDWGHREHWAQLSPRGQEAVKRLGGLDAAKALLGKDALRLKAGFEQAYEQAAASEVLALPAGQSVRVLPAA